MQTLAGWVDGLNDSSWYLPLVTAAAKGLPARRSRHTADMRKWLLVHADGADWHFRAQ